MSDLSLAELTQVLDAPAVSSEGGRARGYQSPQQWRQSLALDDLEDRENLPRGLLTAVLTRESNGYPSARSKAGAQGLFQFMPTTAQAYRIDPNDPAQAAQAAAKELGSHYKRYGGDVSQTLAAWNWGSGNLQKQGMANAPRETRNFISWVTGLLAPGSAEAAERPRGQGAQSTQTGPLTLDALEQLLGTPSQGAQQPAAGTTPPVPTPQTPRLPLVDPAARQEPPSLSPRTPSDLSIDIEKPSTPGPEPDKGLLSDLPGWAKWAAATGISTVGGVGGAVGGGALGTLLAPGVGTGAFGVGGELLGSAAARWLNVKLGLEEPGLVGDIASVAVPAGFRLAGKALRGTIPNLPGAAGVKHEMAEGVVQGLEGRLAPQVASDTLWQQAGTHNNPIATLDVWRTAADVVKRKGATPSLSAEDPALKAAQDLLALAKKSGGPVPIHELDAARRNLQRHLRDPDVKRLYGAILSDMDSAVARGVPGAADLRQAIATTRYEHSLDELAELWSPGRGIQAVGGDTTKVFGSRIANQFEKKLHDNPTFAKAFTPEELADIRETLKVVARLSTDTPAAGGGLGQQLTRHGLALAGAVTGTAMGGPLAGAGTAVAVEAAPYVIAAGMRTPLGRLAIRQALAEGKGRLTATGYAMINEAVRKGLEAAEPERPQPGLSGRPGQWP